MVLCSHWSEQSKTARLPWTPETQPRLASARTRKLGCHDSCASRTFGTPTQGCCGMCSPRQPSPASRAPDLASYTALMLLRAAWCHALIGGQEDLTKRTETAAAAIRLFAGYATELLDQVEPVAREPIALLNATARRALAHVAYPVTCSRIAEVLGLLGVLAAALPNDDPIRSSCQILNVFRRLRVTSEVQPGLARPILNNYAVSLIARRFLLPAKYPSLRVRTSATSLCGWRIDMTTPGRALASPPPGQIWRMR